MAWAWKEMILALLEVMQEATVVELAVVAQMRDPECRQSAL